MLVRAHISGYKQTQMSHDKLSGKSETRTFTVSGEFPKGNRVAREATLRASYSLNVHGIPLTGNDPAG